MISSLPNENLQHIFSFIDEDDFPTLHSIILVNKIWCANGIKLLWKKPLEYDLYSINQSKIINVLLSYNKPEKLSMTNINIKDDNKPTKNLFNYPSFITHLNFSMIVKIVWDFFAVTNEELVRFGHLPQLKFDDDNLSKFDQLITIVMSIFKVISNSEAKIESLELVLDDEDVTLFLDLEENEGGQDDDSINMLYLYQRRVHLFMNKIESLLSCFFKMRISENCFENLKYLYFGRGIIKTNILNSLSTICNNLSIFKIMEENFVDVQDPLSTIIKQQRNLEYIQIIGNNNLQNSQDENANITEIISALEMSSNPFKRIELINLYISSDIALKSFSKFENLESLYLKGLNLPYKNFNYVATADFPKLTSLILVENYDAGASNFDQEPYTEMIRNQKISSNLKELQLTNFDVNNNLELLKAIDSNCKNLLDFAIQITKKDDILYLFSILNNCSRLKRFHLEVFDLVHEQNSINNSEFINDLVKKLPKDLVELKLKDLINTFNNFEKFIKNCEIDLKFFAINFRVEEFIEIERCKEFIEGWSEKKGKKVESCQLILGDEPNSIEIRWK